MRRLLLLAIVGLLAQLVDGALGMAYGLTSATLLAGLGTAPATASASIHLAEVGTCFASGLSHWRFGNVNWRVVRAVALPGAGGAFVGAVALSNLDGEVAKPWVAAFLLVLGALLLARFGFGVGPRPWRAAPSTRFLRGLGGVAGFFDAVGGGGWGPIATPTLLTTSELEPRKVVGSVDTAELVVSLAASAGFLIALTRDGFDLGVVAALLAGGLVAAPIAAWLVRVLPIELLGVAVGGIVLLTNARTLAAALQLDGPLRAATYLTIAVVWAGAVARAATSRRRQHDHPRSPGGDLIGAR